MKIYTIFTKNGKVELPMPDAKVAQAESIMRNPLGELVDKLREMNDLSNRLTKAQFDEQVANSIEKVTFKDVDGREVTLLKGGPGSGCQGDNCGRPSTGGSETDEQRMERLKTTKNPNNPFYEAPDKDSYAHTEAPKDHASSHEDEKNALAFAQKYPDAWHTHAKDPKTMRAIQGLKDKGLIEHSAENNQFRYNTSKKPGSIPAGYGQKPSSSSSIKDAQDYIKYSIPFKHREAVSSYISTDKFHEDVASHEKDVEAEKKTYGAPKGKTAVARAIDGYIKPKMSKSDIVDLERACLWNLQKGGPGSGCHGANCGRPDEGGSEDKGSYVSANGKETYYPDKASADEAIHQENIRQQTENNYTEITQRPATEKPSQESSSQDKPKVDLSESRIKQVTKEWEEEAAKGTKELNERYGENYHKPVVKDGKKYLYLDVKSGGEKGQTSGAFMVDKEDGNIYRIKAYGVVDKNKLVGNINTINGSRLEHMRYAHQREFNQERASSSSSQHDTDNKQVAQTILSQYGGRKLQAMTGAKNFIAVDKGVSFQIPRAKDGITHVVTKLTANDTYDIEFKSVRGSDVKTVHSLKDIYAEDLQRIFTEKTGLDTHL